MKDFMLKAIKNVVWWAVASFIVGMWFGSFVERNRVYGDCRYAGVTRMGEAAFKCEQFSKVVLLTPDEVAKKEKK